MITKRIIPCLDVKNGRVVKGVNFEGLQDMADPVEMARYYNASGADELVFYDITASVEGRGLFTDILNILSLSELGVGTAITYALYAPIAKGDIKKQQILMRMEIMNHLRLLQMIQKIHIGDIIRLRFGLLTVMVSVSVLKKKKTYQ